MNLSKKTLGWSVLALGLVLGGAWTLHATSAVSCDHQNGKATSSASVQNGSADVVPVSGKADMSGGCPAMKAGACGAGAKGKAMAGGACCMGAKATTASTAGPMFPEGTQVTRVDVKGGVDLVFTGKDLAGIRKALDEHLVACNTSKKAGEKCPQCTVASNENNVVLSVRGDNVEQCCAGMMTTGDEAAKSGSCPMMQGAANKTVVKKS